MMLSVYTSTSRVKLTAVFCFPTYGYNQRPAETTELRDAQACLPRVTLGLAKNNCTAAADMYMRPRTPYYGAALSYVYSSAVLRTCHIIYIIYTTAVSGS